MRGTGVNVASKQARCVCGLAETPAMRCGLARADLTCSLAHILTTLSQKPPVGHLAIPNSNSQSQALEAEARRGLESEMMCNVQGPSNLPKSGTP